MSNIEKIDSLNINEKLDKLESPENFFSVWLEKIENLYSNIPENKIKDFMFLCNNIISNDKNIIKKWDFLKTLEKTEVA